MTLLPDTWVLMYQTYRRKISKIFTLNDLIYHSFRRWGLWYFIIAYVKMYIGYKHRTYKRCYVDIEHLCVIIIWHRATTNKINIHDIYIYTCIYNIPYTYIFISLILTYICRQHLWGHWHAELSFKTMQPLNTLMWNQPLFDSGDQFQLSLLLFLFSKYMKSYNKTQSNRSTL